MFTFNSKITRMAVSTAAAVAIVSLSGFVLDQAHIASAPRGIVEVGELTLLDTTPIAAVTLPEVIVFAKRESANTYFAAATELPEVVVVAKRVTYMIAKARTAEQTHLTSVNGSVEGALLK